MARGGTHPVHVLPQRDGAVAVNVEDRTCRRFGLRQTVAFGGWREVRCWYGSQNPSRDIWDSPGLAEVLVEGGKLVAGNGAGVILVKVGKVRRHVAQPLWLERKGQR